MAEMKKVPAIRFNGFNDEWSKDLLGELSDVYDGTHQTPIYTNSGVMFLSVENIQTLKSDKYISKEAFEKDFKTYPQSGDVLMTRIGDIGTANVVETNEPIAYYVSLALLKQKKLHPYFLKHSISTQTVVNDLWRRTLHIAFPKKINKNEIAKVVIPYPIEGEQTQIGNYFHNLDKLINLHQTKVKKLTNLKKAMLEKMLPKQGADVPEIRFKGFAGAWEENALSDFGTATSGTSIESEFSDDGKYKVISIGSYSENSTYTDQGIRAIESEKTIKRVLNKDDLAMVLNDKTLSGNIIGRVLKVEKSGTYVYNQRTQRIETNEEKYDATFLYQLLNAPLVRKKIFRNAQGNTQIYVNWSKVKELKYLIPKLQEQKKIGLYFQNLDKTITLHQTELEKLSNLKKACLEKMFV